MTKLACLSSRLGWSILSIRKGSLRLIPVCDPSSPSAILLLTRFPSHESVHSGLDVYGVVLAVPFSLARFFVLTPPRGIIGGAILSFGAQALSPWNMPFVTIWKWHFGSWQALIEQQSSEMTIFHHCHSLLTVANASFSLWSDCTACLFLIGAHRRGHFTISSIYHSVYVGSLTKNPDLVLPRIDHRAMPQIIMKYQDPMWARKNYSIEIFYRHHHSRLYFLMPFELDNFKRGMPLAYPPSLIFKSLIRELEKAYTGFKALSPLGA